MIVKEIRESSNLSQKQLANLLGCSDSKIYDIENGRRNLNDNDLERLSKIFAERIELSYVAGLFDRASTITITKIPPYKIHKHQVSPTYVTKIMFSSKHRILCEIIKNVFDAGLVSITSNNTKEKRWQFYAHCQEVDQVLEGLLPYIKLKRSKVITMVEFRKFLEESRDEYRHSSWATKSTQDTLAAEWWTTAQTARRLGISSGNIYNTIIRGTLVARKVFINNRTKWEIAPILNAEEIKNTSRKRQPMPQEILDKYEEFYNRIRK